MKDISVPKIATNTRDLNDDDLILLRVEIEKEIDKRGLKFSVGEVGEKLAIRFFNETPGLPNLIAAPIGAKNVDALSRDGDRYTIKTIQKAKKTGTIYPDSKDKEKQLFEFLLLVHLDDNYNLKALYRFSWDQFNKNKAWDKRMTAWYVPLSSSRLKDCETLLVNVINKNEK
jgi:hypothetical protein